ncbi:MAG: PilZ domain-containing protein, partial [Acidimicrobiia bacterium]
VHLGGARPAVAPGEVVASFVAPDALYRVRATLSPHDGAAGVVDLRSHHVERVQRRAASRVALAVPAVLSNFDDPAADDRAAFSSVSGETVDLGEGGCRVRVRHPFPEGCDPTVTLELPGRSVVALAAISQALELPDGHEYRLVFLAIDDADRAALRRLAAD